MSQWGTRLIRVRFLMLFWFDTNVIPFVSRCSFFSGSSFEGCLKAFRSSNQLPIRAELEYPSQFIDRF